MRTEQTRRFFLRSGACALCAGVLSPLLSSCDTVIDGEPTLRLPDERALQRLGGAVRKRFAAVNGGEAVFIIRESEHGFTAYAAQCTHQSVELRPPAEGEMVCPNHGSRFTTSDGSVIEGKATVPLPRFGVRYDAQAQTITLLPSLP